jgi:ankyrin repeat protein
MVRLLLDKGALPSLKGIHGWSPLDLAKNRRDKELPKMLKKR